MKMRILSRQPRRRKDRCNSTYCHGKKIRAGTHFRDSPPAMLADCLQPERTTVGERSSGRGSPFLLDRVPTYSVNLNRSKSLAILRGRASPTDCGFAMDWSVFRPVVCLPLFSLPAAIRRLCSILRRGCRTADIREKRLRLAADPKLRSALGSGSQ